MISLCCHDFSGMNTGFKGDGDLSLGSCLINDDKLAERFITLEN